MAIGFTDAHGFQPLTFNNGNQSVSPLNVNPIKTQAMEFRSVVGASLFLSTTLDAALNVTVEVAASPDDPFVPVGAAKNVPVPAGGVVVLDEDDLPKLKNHYPYVRFSIVPATAPSTGTLSGKLYRAW